MHFKVPALALGLLTPFCLSSAQAFDLYTDADTSLSFDGRVQFRYNTYQDDSHRWDGDSRWALVATQAINDELDFLAKGEWSVYATEDDYDDDQHVTQRLLYAGLDHDRYGELTVGKLWGVVYDVGWWTDMGRKFGSRAFGVYNFDDWGQVSGAGRADNAVAWRQSFGDWKLGLQYQGRRGDKELAFGVEADLTEGIGASLRRPVGENLEAGVAYIQNTYEDVTPGSGVSDGDKGRLWLAGIKYATDHIHAAMHVGYSQDWEIAPNGQFYDALGIQAYSYYHFANGLRPNVNFNWLDDTGEDSEGYRRLTYSFGLEYHFIRDRFLVWSDYQINHGSNGWDSQERHYGDADSEWALGIRYDF
ncbi:porin [Halomonas urmiana]|nr:porin [Halomonas urmiana]